MKKEALSLFNNPDMVLLAFMLFFFTFLGVVFWTFRRSGRGHYKAMAQAPLKTDETMEAQP